MKDSTYNSMNLKIKMSLMKVEQIQPVGGFEKDVLFTALKDIIPDFSYPDGFYPKLQQFLFTNPHSFFDNKNLPPFLSRTIQQLSEEDADNLLTVLEGAKALIMEHQLKDMAAYNQLIMDSSKNRFFSVNTTN